ncbi:MAG: permease prefix domain 1-containing protein [Defluviitaleaceae bacterium]|nr:permease prefix domain 1-containing protein [Defluviitaleaceae bacterium]
MDTIKTYLDNVFAAFPQTDSVQTLKRDMLAGMEEKYLSLRQQGNNENEAIGIVIANFGSIDEISQELGIAPEPTKHKNIAIPPEKVIELSLHEAQSYISQSKNLGHGMGFALVLISIGVYLPALGIADFNYSTVLLGGGVVIIVAGLLWAYTNFASYRKANIILSSQDHMALTIRYTRFIRHTIVFCIVFIVTFIALGLLEAHWHYLLTVYVCILAFAAPALLYAKIAYDYLLGKWLYKSGRWVYSR